LVGREAAARAIQASSTLNQGDLGTVEGGDSAGVHISDQGNPAATQHPGDRQQGSSKGGGVGGGHGATG